jgi:large subunit ribosomal protein L21
MYAIVEIAGQQFRVNSGQEIFVHRLAGKVGDNIKFDKVLMTNNDGAVRIGTPAIAGASVSATIVDHLKGDKVIVFKKKRRKGYRVRNGHRQCLTKIKINSI